ncbi:MAG: tyrosine--tRNA ligase [Deltaproteobacteria bacterium]|nr:tyrosine--tRNA ligase [Deltaproteobacteria bacterium]
MTTLLAELKEREMIHDVSNFEELEKHLEEAPRVVYCGFDPTADSLHIGHLVPLLMLRYFQKRGHTPIAIVGSATGMIGDPSFKSEERKLLDAETIAKNCIGLEEVIGRFLSKDGPNGYIMLRNDTWFRPINCLDFLRDIGKHFSVNAMIAKESVRARLEEREQGISYTEFSYMLLQSYDYYHLNEKYSCTVQIGGSDQWGNITSGIDLIRRKSKGEINVHAVSFPLITTFGGQKFGKSEGNAVWLSKRKLSPYEFYQFWINVADDDIKHMLTVFTDLPLSEISTVIETWLKKPEERLAQKTLARIMTTMAHGEEETQKAIKASEVLFGGSMAGLNSETLLSIFKAVPATAVSEEQVSAGIGVLDLLTITQLANSKGAAKRLVEGGGVYINNEKCSDAGEKVTAERFVDKKVLVLRSGKRNYHLLTIS